MTYMILQSNVGACPIIIVGLAEIISRKLGGVAARIVGTYL